MRNTRNRGFASAGMVLVLGLGTALAQTGTARQTQPTAGANAPGSMNSPGGGMSGSMSGMNMPGQASVQDKTFLKAATDGGLFEIKTSQLALQKSNSADVKQYAQQMIDDHTKLMEQMKPVAAEAGVTPQTDLQTKLHKTEYKKLQGLSGDAFDQAYIKDQLMDHQQTEQAFKTEESSGQLADEKSAATQGQPIIDDHMQKIQQIAQAHNVSTSGL